MLHQSSVRIMSTTPK